MQALTPIDIAYHQAGHAVVAHALGWRVTHLSIERDGECVGNCLVLPPVDYSEHIYLVQEDSFRRRTEEEQRAEIEAEQMRERLLYTFAGSLASEMASGEYDRWREQETLRVIRDKYPEDAKQRYWINYMKYYGEQRARIILSKRWQAVEDLAGALLRQKTLDEQQVLTFIRNALHHKSV